MVGKMTDQEKQFFSSQEELDLWIRLDAEYQIEWEKNLTWFDSSDNTYKPTKQALHHRSIEQALEIAARRLDYDIKKGKLRFTLEQLQTLTIEELEDIRLQQHREWLRVNFAD